MAKNGGDTAACGGLQRIAPGVDEVKRMWVHPDWRGAGLAGRLLRHLEHLAAERGHDVVRLDTNGVLTDAIAMYERAGYRHIERYNDNPYARGVVREAAHASGVSRSQSVTIGTSAAAAQAASWSWWWGWAGSPDAPVGTTQPPASRSARSHT